MRCFGTYILLRMKRKFAPAIILLLVAAACAGFFVGRWQQNLGKAISPAIPTDFKTFIGNVKNISGNAFVVKASSLNPYVSKLPAELTVMLGTSTVIERVKQKDRSVFERELKAFSRKIHLNAIPAPSIPTLPPEPFTYEKISQASIKVGDTISVHASENIINAKSVFAVSVIVLTQNVLPNFVPAESRGSNSGINTPLL